MDCSVFVYVRQSPRTKSKVANKFALEADNAIMVNARHYNCIIEAQSAISKAISSLKIGNYTELIIADLKIAVDAFGRITGKITNEEILGNIFSQFCIGK